MSFKSIDHVLDQLGDRYRLRDQQYSQRLLKAWVEAVGSVVAAQTRPLSMHNEVLRVATSSAAWAQNLVFERQRILAKLNVLLSASLTDIRFSNAQWQTQSRSAFNEELQTELWQQHPSRLTDAVRSIDVPQSERLTDPLLAFALWRKLMRARTQNMPLCPQCQCPTPSGELKRWALCSLCAAKQW
ncbi:MAG TPA: DciA family protein [Candidatus Sericytochromatia bacterium]